MQQQFDTSSDPARVPEEIIFEEPTHMRFENPKRLTTSYFIITVIVVCTYAALHYFLFHRMPFYIIDIAGICILCFPSTLLSLTIWKWGAILRYLKQVRKESEQCYASYVPIRVDISRPGPDLPASNDILDFLQLLDQSVLVLGSPGAGKTIVLEVYPQKMLEPYRLWHVSNWFIPAFIPIFISLKDYNAFLKSYDSINSPDSLNSTNAELTNATSPRMLRNYLYHRNGPENIRSLRPYLRRLIRKGRVLLLCDGLNEVDSNYWKELSSELSALMTQNYIIMTCRELDYHNSAFEKVFSKHSIPIATIKPLESDQQDAFIRQYFMHEEYTLSQEETWQSASEGVIYIIDAKKLRPECGNPFILRHLTRTLHSIGITKEIDTRGQLFREAISLMIEDKIQNQPFTEDDLLLYLGEIACTIRRMKSRNGLVLPNVSSKNDDPKYYREAADSLKSFTNPPSALNQALDPFSHPEPTDFPDEKRVEMLKFAAKMPDLVSISQSKHILSFSHELMAEYFVAEYLYRMCRRMYERDNKITLPYGKELIDTEGDWNEPIHIWAGLLDDATFLNPMSLAEVLGNIGKDCQFDENKDRMYNALTLGMLCLGVHWTPSSILQQESPSSLCDLLSRCISDDEKRTHLKAIFERCAQEGGDSVYRPLLKVLTFEGTDKLLSLLPKTSISNLLFEYLSMIDGGTYEKEIRTLTVILGNMGGFVVERAKEMSKPAGKKSIRLRRAAIAILGYTKDANVVLPLLSCLDEEGEITDETITAFQHLGPDIALKPLRQELLATGGLYPYKRRIEILKIIGKFLSGDDIPTTIQYKESIKDLISMLSSPVQQETKNLLLSEARSNRPFAHDVKEELVLALSSSNPIIVGNLEGILVYIGHEATKHLLNHLKSPDATDTMRTHIVEVLGRIHNLSALKDLYNRVADPSSDVRDAIANALSKYPAEEVVPVLIDKVLNRNKDEATAARDALVRFGREGVELIGRHLFDNAKPVRVASLVEVLQNMGDERAIPYLIDRIEQLHTQSLSADDLERLALSVVDALSSFKGESIVKELLHILDTWPIDVHQNVYNHASWGLSKQGSFSLQALLAALDVEKVEAKTKGIQSAIYMMQPFPASALLEVLGHDKGAQVGYIMEIFIWRGKEEASFLVQQLRHKNTRVQSRIHEILEQLDAETLVEPLLQWLSEDAYYSVVVQHLRRYPDTAIPRLVALLGDTKLGKIAVRTLIEFDTLVVKHLRNLITAFDKPNDSAALQTKQVIVELAKSHTELFSSMIELFHTITADEYAYEAIVHVLSTSLAYGSVSILLNELTSTDPLMQQGVTDALVLLGREHEIYSEEVIHELIAALSVTEKRQQAEKVLVRIGQKAIPHLEPLVISTDPIERESIHRILSKIGPLAFDILSSYLSSRDSEYISAAEHIVANMETRDIKDPLLQLLSSQNIQKVEQGLVLLLGRVRADLRTPSDKQKMVTVLLEHTQTHPSDHTTVLILNFLLLLPERRQLLVTFQQVLSKYPQTQQWFMPLFLLLNMEGDEAKGTLLRLLQDGTTTSLEKEFVGTLGMLEPHELVTKYATSIGAFAQAAGMPLRDDQIFQIERSRRAVGSLLVSDHWNTQRLQELQNKEPVESIRHELYTVLLGESYMPKIDSLRDENEDKEKLLKQAKDAIDQLEIDVKVLTGHKEEADKLIDSLKREKTNLSREKKEALDKNTSLDDMIKDLREDNRRLRWENERLRLRSFPPSRPRF